MKEHLILSCVANKATALLHAEKKDFRPCDKCFMSSYS